ncbi:hypothetical protein CHUAL_001374 [Chamberlinius hualienensis]
MDNQPINYIPYAVSVEMDNYVSDEPSEDESVLHSIMPQLLNSEEISLSIVDTTTQTTPTQASQQKTSEDILNKYETEETVLLSNLQLQRLLIQHQLKYYDMKEKKLRIETEREASLAARQMKVDEIMSMYKEFKPEVKRIKLSTTAGNETNEDSGGGSSSGRDEFTVFGEYVASKLRKLKNRRLKTLAQFKICHSLSEIELEDEIYIQSPH